MKTSVTTCTSIWMRLSFIRSRFDETGKKIHENHPVDKNPPKSTYQRNKSVNKVILLLITNSSPHKKANYLLSHKNHEHFFPVELTEHTHRAVWRPSILSSLSAKKKNPTKPSTSRSTGCRKKSTKTNSTPPAQFHHGLSRRSRPRILRRSCRTGAHNTRHCATREPAEKQKPQTDCFLGDFF